VREGRVTLSVEVEGAPASVAIDPFVRRIDLDRTDNVLPVTSVQ
jgi:hypothetical protein